MKNLFVLGLVVFWTSVTALIAAALVVNELKPDNDNSGQIETQSQTQTETQVDASTTTSTLDLATVATHNQVNDCWIVVEDNVYNVTEYIPFHPGGEQMIIDSCGSDATEDFNDRDGEGTSHSVSAKAQLEQYFINSLGAALTEATETNSAGTTDSATDTTPSDTNTDDTESTTNTTTPPATSTLTQTTLSLTSAEVAKHTSANDCWVIVDGSVYNVTEYIPFHPGGSSRIANRCGTDVSTDFSGSNGGHRHSSSARNTLSRYLVGTLGAKVTESTVTQITNVSVSDSTTANNSIESIIQNEFPGAIVTRIEHEDDGRSEVKFSWNGETYEAKLNSQNEIVKVDD